MIVIIFIKGSCINEIWNNIDKYIYIKSRLFKNVNKVIWNFDGCIKYCLNSCFIVC